MQPSTISFKKTLNYSSSYRELGRDLPEGDSRQEAVLVMLAKRVEILKEKLRGLEKGHQLRLTEGERGEGDGESEEYLLSFICGVQCVCSTGAAEDQFRETGREEIGVDSAG